MRSAFDIIANVVVQGLDEVKKLIGGVKKVGDTGEDTNKKLRPLRDRLQDLGTLFRDSGDAGGRLGDALDMVAVTATPAGAGILGVVGALGLAKLQFDLIQKSITTYIENNEQANAANERLNNSLVRLNASIVEAIVGENGLAHALNLTADAVDSVTLAVEKDADGMARMVSEGAALGQQMGLLLQPITSVVNALSSFENISKNIEDGSLEQKFRGIANTSESMANTLRGVLGALGQTGDATENLESALDRFGGASSFVTTASVSLQTAIDQLTMTQDLATSAADNLAMSTDGLKISLEGVDGVANTVGGSLVQLANDTYKLVEAQDEALRFVQQMRAAAGAGGGVQGPLTAAGKFVAPVKRKTTGGRRGKSKAERRQESSQALVDEMFGDLLQDPDFLATLVPETEEVVVAPRLSTGETVEEFRGRMDGYGAAIKDLKDDLDALDLEQEALFQQGFRAGREITLQAKESFMQLGGSVAFAMGEMAAGASTLKDFGDAMSDLAGQIAGDFGQLFIRLGAGFILTSPALGAGLIAAGVGLQVLSGFLSGKGSGNRGGGGGRSSAGGAGRDIAREISRSLRPSGDDGPAVTNIEVVIGGRSIQPEMVAIIDDIARQRRSRYLGRRMGV